MLGAGGAGDRADHAGAAQSKRGELGDVRLLDPADREDGHVHGGRHGRHAGGTDDALLFFDRGRKGGTAAYVVGAGGHRLARRLRAGRRRADQEALGRDSTRRIDTQVVGAEMHAVRARRQRDVRVVVDDEEHPRAGGQLADAQRHLQQLTTRQGFVP